MKLINKVFYVHGVKVRAFGLQIGVVPLMMMWGKGASPVCKEEMYRAYLIANQAN